MVSLPTSMAGVPGSATRGATPEQQYPQGVYTNWGDAACLHGVAKTPEGLAFGSNMCISQRRRRHLQAGHVSRRVRAGRRRCKGPLEVVHKSDGLPRPRRCASTWPA